MNSFNNIIKKTDNNLNISSLGKAIGRVSQFNIYLNHNIDSLKEIWTNFQNTAVMTPYQQFGWVQAWFNSFGKAESRDPMIISAIDSFGLCFILPMYVKRCGPLRILTWIGGKHTNYNMGLYRRDVSERLTADVIQEILKCVSKNGSRIDVVQLNDQPERWDNFDNPFLSINHDKAPNIALSVNLQGGFDHYFKTIVRKRARKRYRAQTRKIAEAGHSVSFEVTKTPAESLEIFSTFLKQRRDRFREQGIKNPFENENAILFYLDLIRRSQPDQANLLTFYSLTIDGQIRAIFAGVEQRGRFSACLTSFSNDDLSSLSPGEFLLHHLIQDRVETGDHFFDLGIGNARYKRSWCDTIDVLFNTLEPVSAMGHIVAPVLRTANRTKCGIKNSEALWSCVTALRKVKSSIMCLFHPCDKDRDMLSNETLSEHITACTKPGHKKTNG